MPPKAAAPAVQQKSKNFTLNCCIRNRQPPLPNVAISEEPVQTPSLAEGYRLRICSSWSPCSISTPLIGDKALPWIIDEETKSQSTSFSYQFDGDVESHEQLLNFHNSPYVYVFVYHVNTLSLKMSSFFTIDCSIFLLETTSTKVCRNISDILDVTVSIFNERQISDINTLIPYEPLKLCVEE